MSDPFLGEIKMWAGNFALRGFALCNGQTLSIAQNDALFTLLGTTYGGNGTNTFMLPDLRGRSPVHWGQRPGSSSVAIGEVRGEEYRTLTVSNLPVHTHDLNVSTVAGTQNTPQSGSMLASSSQRDPQYIAASGSGTSVPITGVVPAGGSTPFSILPPTLAVTFIIALAGVFPSRN